MNLKPDSKTLLNYARARLRNQDLDYRELEEYGISLVEAKDSGHMKRKREVKPHEFWTLTKTIDNYAEVLE